MYGYIMIAYGIIYALLGVLVMAGMLQGLMPGYESGEMLIMVLAFVVAILAISRAKTEKTATVDKRLSFFSFVRKECWQLSARRVKYSYQITIKKGEK